MHSAWARFCPLETECIHTAGYSCLKACKLACRFLRLLRMTELVLEWTETAKLRNCINSQRHARKPFGILHFLSGRANDAVVPRGQRYLWILGCTWLIELGNPELSFQAIFGRTTGDSKNTSSKEAAMWVNVELSNSDKKRHQGTHWACAEDYEINSTNKTWRRRNKQWVMVQGFNIIHINHIRI